MPESRHPWVVPSVDEVLVDESVQFPLRHHSICEVQTVELNLSWAVVVEAILSCSVHFLQEIDEFIVQRTVRNELESTNRVGDPLEVIALSVCEIVHWVAVPLSSCTMVWSLNDTIHYWIAEVHVRIGHIEFGSQHHASLHSLGSVHLVEEAQILLYGSVAVWTRCSRLRRSALLLGNLLRCLLVNVCIAVLDHPDGKIPEFVEIIAGIIYMSPFEAEPLNIVEDILNIFGVLFDGLVSSKRRLQTPP